MCVLLQAAAIFNSAFGSFLVSGIEGIHDIDQSDSSRCVTVVSVWLN